MRLEVGAEPGLDGLAESLALAGYERVERAEERGQFAVRGGLVDVFPTTGREPLRVELYGDEIEQVRAFSPFTQRALHPVDDAVDLSGRRAARRSDEPTLADDEAPSARPPEIPNDLVPVLDRVPDFVWQPDEVRRVWVGGGTRRDLAEGHVRARPVPAVRSRSRSRPSGRRSPRAGSPRPRTS